MSGLFAVVEHNQASGRPDDQSVSFCDSIPEALGLADGLTTDNRADGRRERYRIYRLDEVDDDELHEWAIRTPDGNLMPIHFHDFGARRDCPDGHTVVKRRLGTDTWTTANEEDR